MSEQTAEPEGGEAAGARQKPKCTRGATSCPCGAGPQTLYPCAYDVVARIAPPDQMHGGVHGLPCLGWLR